MQRVTTMMLHRTSDDGFNPSEDERPGVPITGFGMGNAISWRDGFNQAQPSSQTLPLNLAPH